MQPEFIFFLKREVNKWGDLNGHLARSDQTSTGSFWRCPLGWKPQRPFWCQEGMCPEAASRLEATLSPGLPLFHRNGSWPGLRVRWDLGQCSEVGRSIPCWFASSCSCNSKSPAVLLSARRCCQPQDTAPCVNGPTAWWWHPQWPGNLTPRGPSSWKEVCLTSLEITTVRCHPWNHQG